MFSLSYQCVRKVSCRTHMRKKHSWPTVAKVTSFKSDLGIPRFVLAALLCWQKKDLKIKTMSMLTERASEPSCECCQISTKAVKDIDHCSMERISYEGSSSPSTSFNFKSICELVRLVHSGRSSIGRVLLPFRCYIVIMRGKPLSLKLCCLSDTLLGFKIVRQGPKTL